MSTRARVIIASVVAIIILASTLVVITLRSVEPRLRQWLVSHLSESFEGQVDLESARLTWLPLRLVATNLTVRHHGRTDVPPLLVVSSFAMDLKATDIWTSTIDRVHVDGLEINIPPKDAGTGERPLPAPGSHNPNAQPGGRALFIRRLTATNARLAVIPREFSKNARVWDIFELELQNIGNGSHVPFTAALINPIPYGTVEATGQFGPWNSDAPGNSPLRGSYTFTADLGTIDGLAGGLSAKGDMSGVFDRIVTTGNTETPNFKLTEVDGTALPLHTTYEAVVHGANGDVELKTVDITLGKSRMMARGLLDGTKGVTGKRLIVSVKSSATHLGEVLQLISPVSDTMTGFKRWVLKPFNALLRRDGAGTRLVIEVDGTQDDPRLHIDFGRSLRGRQPRDRRTGRRAETDTMNPPEFFLGPRAIACHPPPCVAAARQRDNVICRARES
ncbi:MAG: hypothetical protein RLZZ53_615 [Acidobacteriota bacterium]